MFREKCSSDLPEAVVFHMFHFINLRYTSWASDAGGVQTVDMGWALEDEMHELDVS
jgi:hypothetical protein